MDVDAWCCGLTSSLKVAVRFISSCSLLAVGARCCGLLECALCLNTSDFITHWLLLVLPHSVVM